VNFRRERQVVIVGGGPAGLAAAIEVRRSGLEVTVIDERPAVGGQIFKQPLPGMTRHPGHKADRIERTGSSLIAEAETSGAELLTQTAVWGIWGRKLAVYREPDVAGIVEAGQVILATGAYDRPVVFPGWTLPGVMAAGGVHSLMKTQRIAPGRRVLVAGSGPLLLMFAAQLLRHGVPVTEVLEAAPRPGPRALARFARAASGNTATLRDGLGYLAAIARRRVSVKYSHIIVRAEGTHRVERAVVARVDEEWRPIAGTERSLEVDTIAIGYGLVPSVELAVLAGCALRYDEDLGGHVPVRDSWMRTTAAGVWAVGDGSGIGGSESAAAEGRLAGIAVALDAGAITPAEAERRAAPVRTRLRQLGRLRDALTKTYRVQHGIYGLTTRDTVVCRCEEVSASAILSTDDGGDPNVLRALTRVGMGGCQGKECTRQAAALLADRCAISIAEMPVVTPRAPVRPVRVGAIAEDRPDEAPPEITGR
jgi:thioredoxin reductase